MPSRRRYLGGVCTVLATMAGCTSKSNSNEKVTEDERSTTGSKYTEAPADPTADDLAVYNTDSKEHEIEIEILRDEKSRFDTSVTLSPNADRHFEDVFPSPEEGPLTYSIQILVDGVKTEKEFTLRDGSGFRELHLTVESKKSVTMEPLIH